MQHIPYDDELEIINSIHKYNTNTYVPIRLTQTMIDKSIIDANGFLRKFLLDFDLLDYDQLTEKNFLEANLILEDQIFTVKVSFYKANARGDQRFWIYGLKNIIRSSKIQVNDLLYFSVDNKKEKKLTICNVSRSIPSENVIVKFFGQDKLEEKLNELIPKIKAISKKGYHNNSKGKGKIHPKDAGNTLEFLLGIKPNNSKEPDYERTIELKTKTSKSLDTLFTLRPNFQGTPVSEYEPIDKNRVSAFTRLYGYDSEQHDGFKSLYITIGPKESPQNNQGFYLEVNDEDSIVELRKVENSSSILVAFWDFKSLEKKLKEKHPATLWVEAIPKMDGEMGQFKYVKAELTRSPQFMTFLSLIKSGTITYDWRGYTTPEGNYTGKNHGNPFRIKNKQRGLLFGSSEIISLDD